MGDTRLGPYTIKLSTGDKVVIIGPNGGGKTTFLKIIAKLIPIKSGSLNIGNGITIGYIDQEYTFPNPRVTVESNLRKMTGLNTPELYNILARFNVKKEKALALPGKLSPGERSRALLAGMVARGANMLLLDEPTNHLDISASDELQSALKHYKGTLVVVTHDRELIESLKDKKITVIEDGQILTELRADEYIKKVLKDQ